MTHADAMVASYMEWFALMERIGAIRKYVTTDAVAWVLPIQEDSLYVDGPHDADKPAKGR